MSLANNPEINRLQRLSMAPAPVAAPNSDDTCDDVSRNAVANRLQELRSAVGNNTVNENRTTEVEQLRIFICKKFIVEEIAQRLGRSVNGISPSNVDDLLNQFLQEAQNLSKDDKKSLINEISGLRVGGGQGVVESVINELADGDPSLLDQQLDEPDENLNILDQSSNYKKAPNSRMTAFSAFG